MTSAPETSSLPTKTGSLALLRDFRLLLFLFIGFRLLLLLVYQPVLVDDAERGVSAGGDFIFYFALAALSDEGHLPYRDFWYEFPPLVPATWLGVYQLTLSDEGDNYTAFAGLLGLIMLAFDTGNLILLRRLGAILYGRDTGVALAWIYAALLAPVVFLWWNFEPMVAFWLLLSVWWLVRGRAARSAVAAAVGGLVKFVPLITLGAVWRFLDWRAALRYTLVALAVFGLAYAVLVLAAGEMGMASLVAQFNKSSYGTIWALLDGNHTTGNFGAPELRFDPATATEPGGEPPVISSWLRLIVFGGLGAFVFFRTCRDDPQGIVAFVGLTLLIFFLWAQGWSPQWLALIIPFALLAFPSRQGVLAVLLLSFVTFAEYPLLFIRTGDAGGIITGSLMTPFVVLVLARTALLAGLAVALYRQLRRPASRME